MSALSLEDVLQAQLATLSTELDRRAKIAERLEPYDEGGCAIPEAVVRVRMTNAYRLLMGMSEAPWGSLVVDSVLDRLEVSGIRSGDESVDQALWEIWQANRMDSESKLAHRSALRDGRAFALVWADETGYPEISLDDMTQMVVAYREGSRYRRTAALRRWIDESGKAFATLYRPDGIYKYVSVERNGVSTWMPRGADWILENPLGVVPVVELAVNRKLKAGVFPYARGEYEHVTGLLDRINLLTFVGLVVALWLGFPLRGVIGDKIIRDDDGNALPPFDVSADAVFQLEDPNAKLAEFQAADRRNLAIYPELDQLAVITKTPRHYFPLEQGMSNLSADAIRASEGGLHAKVTSHKASLGEGHEETLRLAGRILPQEITLPPGAETVWADHESRSLAERADAASKLKDILPAQAIMEMVLNATPEQIARWEAQGAIGQLLAAAATTPAAPAAAPAGA